MKSDIDEVALQGIEFWSNVCDEEMDLAIEASEVSLGWASLRRAAVLPRSYTFRLWVSFFWKPSILTG